MRRSGIATAGVVALLGLATAAALGAALLAAAGCKNDPTPACVSPGGAACVLLEGGAQASFVPCVQDECSIATLRAIVTVELQATALGKSGAANPRVSAAVAQMAADFAGDESALDALEAQLAIAEAPCAETQTLSDDLASDLAPLQSAIGAAFDEAFVASQQAALTEVKQSINLDLIGCAANGNLKTFLRFVRLRTLDGGTSLTAFDGGAALGIVPDLAAIQALVDGGATVTATLDGGGVDARAGDAADHD
jgi:predicted outer membrane protein